MNATTETFFIVEVKSAVPGDIKWYPIHFGGGEIVNHPSLADALVEAQDAVKALGRPARIVRCIQNRKIVKMVKA
jgi:hypothetical protein